MSPFGIVGIPIAVVGALVPGAVLGVWLGRWGHPVEVVALAIFGVELCISVRSGQPVYGLSAYVLLVGRCARRVDPRVRLLGARLRLHPFGDVELPLVAPGIFSGAALGFALQAIPRLWALPLAVGVVPAGLVAGVFGVAALALDLQHASALEEAGALRGATGPVLLPHLSVADHLDASVVRAADAPLVPEVLAGVRHRRPRHLTPPERLALAAALPAGAGG